MVGIVIQATETMEFEDGLRMGVHPGVWNIRVNQSELNHFIQGENSRLKKGRIQHNFCYLST